jgi:hypothetical protein
MPALSSQLLVSALLAALVAAVVTGAWSVRDPVAGRCGRWITPAAGVTRSGRCRAWVASRS